MPHVSRREFFSGHQDALLAARLETPDEGEPAALVVISHCFTCSKDYKAIKRIATELANAGIAAFRFDMTGLAESRGDFSRTTLSTNVQDLARAVEYARSLVDAPLFLMGHSLGGAASILSAPTIEGVRGLVTLAAPSTTKALQRLQLAQRKPAGEGLWQIEVGGIAYRLRDEFFDDLGQHDLLATLRSFQRPLLVLHSPSDETVDYDHALKLFEAAGGPKSLFTLQGADHLLVGDRQAPAWTAGAIDSWIRFILAAEGRGGVAGSM
ncbi:MAG TPA: alpha/beta fold hydrolase [Pirellulaceae bacterium]|jgi:putative redox protein|nr:alpha/beta fold hydrolase [Pirellulaceae bacterium]